MHSALSTLNQQFGAGTGHVGVDETKTGFEFTVVSEGYFDRPGSPVEFRQRQRGDYLYLEQIANGDGLNPLVEIGVPIRARFVWRQEALA